MFTPISKAQIYSNVPLDISNDNQRWWTSKSEQSNYFASTPAKLLDISDVDYVEESWIFYVGEPKENLLNANYMRFMNSDRKWFYCFVTELIYVNPNTTGIRFTVDDFQTYFFDLTFLPCMVEREHSSTDSIGSNVIAEPFQITDRIATAEYEGNTYSDMVYIIDTTLDLSDTSFNSYVGGGTYGGITHGSVWYGFKNIQTLNQIIDDVGKAGKLDSIINIFMLPSTYVQIRRDNNRIIDSADVDIGYIDVPYPSTLNGYTPKNKKLLTYPYIEFIVTNKGNEIKSFRPERFSSRSNIQFKQFRIPNISTPAICFPTNYNGIENDFKNCVSLLPFPQVSWINNPFGDWVNANMGSTVASLFSGAVSGAMMGSGVMGIGAVAGAGLGALASAMVSYGQSVNAYNQPPTSEGNAGSNNAILSSAFENTFRVEVRTLDKDNAKSIDDFLTRFGYKTNELKMPNFNTRKSWNYVKTTEMSLKGSCPSDSIKRIKDMFNRGITLWHTNDIGNFGLDNSIV